jgi:hypothetical protein
MGIEIVMLLDLGLRSKNNNDDELHLCCDKDHLRQSGAWEGQNGSRAMDWSWKNNRKLQLLTQIALSCIVVFLYCKKY